MLIINEGISLAFHDENLIFYIVRGWTDENIKKSIDFMAALDNYLKLANVLHETFEKKFGDGKVIDQIRIPIGNPAKEDELKKGVEAILGYAMEMESCLKTALTCNASKCG